MLNGMENLFRHLASLLGVFGYEIRRQTPKIRFLQLISDLWPSQSQFNLIRVGGDSDGAYLVPDCLVGDEILISPGVGGSILFELEILKRFGIPSILIDPTVESPLELPNSCIFISKWLNSFDDDTHITLDSIYQKYALGKKLIIQMDIEGAEYSILRSLNEEIANNTKVLIVELHNVSFWRNLIFFESVVEPALSRMFQYFYPIHIKPNTASTKFTHYGVSLFDTLELTLISRLESDLGDKVLELPHLLDVANTKGGTVPSFPRLNIE
jgi:hypothetical protein